MIENYHEFKKYLDSLETKPKLLVHACCGPCSTHSLKVLVPYFDITVYYDNDNIDTLEEYNKREEELSKVIESFDDIKLIVKEYEPKRYYEVVKGKEHLGEFSERCSNCMALRMEDTCKYAKDNGYDFFTTTLSISPYKSSKEINTIGYMLADKYNVGFLYSDFKKENGYQDSIKMSHELGLYRQDYCGCVFSKKEHEEKIK